MQCFTALILLAFSVVATSYRHNGPKNEKNNESYSLADKYRGRPNENLQQMVKETCARAIRDYKLHLMEKKKSFWKVVPEIASEIYKEETRPRLYLNCGPILLLQKPPGLSHNGNMSHERTTDENYAKHAKESQNLCDEVIRDYGFALKEEHKSYWKYVPEFPGQIVFHEPHFQIGLDCGSIILTIAMMPPLPKPYPRNMVPHSHTEPQMEHHSHPHYKNRRA